VSVVEKKPIESYKLRGEAKGRLGWVRGDASFTLQEDPGGTAVSSTMNFQTGGVLSGVGQRFMQAIAKSMLRDFFKAFERELGPAGAPTARPSGGAAA
jgi:carbon monoxide dehydrogenase subunit G